MHTVVVGTAGHIDHGKSALVKALTGTDPDRLKEEQERGITIDLGFAHFEAGDRQVAFVDVPGHERFVRNMLAGAGGIDAVLLVVDAGESVMPQTREHFDICRLLGLDRGIVALSKVDAAGPDAILRARVEVAALVAGSFLEGAPVLEVSARTGHGLDALRAELLQLVGRPSRQQRSGLVRLPVDRAFTIKGFGAVVTGTLVSGDVGENDALIVLPDRRTVRVRGVQTHGRRVSRVSSPQRAALNLAGVEAADLHRGQTIATDASLSVTRSADVQMELLAGARALRHGTRVRVHSGASEIAARVSVAAMRVRPSDAWAAVAPGAARVEIPGGATAFVRLRFAAAAVLTRGDRLVFRAGSPAITIGGGIVLDPEPPLTGVRRARSLQRFLDLSAAAPPFAALLTERGEHGLTPADLIRRCGADARAASGAVAELVDAGIASRVGDRIVHTKMLEGLEERVTAELRRFHDSSPTEIGLARGALRDRAGKRLADDLLGAALGRLSARGVITGTDRVALAGRAPAVSDAQLRLAARVEAELLAGKLAPADPGTVARSVGAPPAEVDRAIQWLVRDKRVIRAGDLFFHRDALARLKDAVQSIRAGQPAAARVTLDVATFKAHFNLSRKHAIPLLEWLDRERVTRRTGDVRIVL